MSISAFYQCYKQPIAFEHCLKTFREHYPSAELWIVNDGGDPGLADIAAKYTPTHYEMKERLGQNEIGTVFGKKESTIEWLQRLRSFLMATTSEFFLLLEDDVYVMGPTSTADLKYDINGCNKSVRYIEPIVTIIRERNPDVPNPLYFGGCGGCFFRVSFFRQLFQDFDTILKEMDAYAIHYKTEFGSDMVISYLTWIHGGTIEMYPGFAETWFYNIHERLDSKSVEVLHKYKDLYTK